MASSTAAEVCEVAIHPDYKPRPGANLCLRSAKSSEEGSHGQSTRFYVEEQVLARASVVFRDMVTLGTTSKLEEEVQMEEDKDTIDLLLRSIQQDDVAKIPQPSDMNASRLLKLYSATMKYQMVTVQFIMEQEIRSRLPFGSGDIYRSDNISILINLACSNSRKDLSYDVVDCVLDNCTSLDKPYLPDLVSKLDAAGSTLLLRKLGLLHREQSTPVQKGLENIASLLDRNISAGGQPVFCQEALAMVQQVQQDFAFFV